MQEISTLQTLAQEAYQKKCRARKEQGETMEEAEDEGHVIILTDVTELHLATQIVLADMEQEARMSRSLVIPEIRVRDLQMEEQEEWREEFELPKDGYIKWKQKTEEEQDKEVEYCLESDDDLWLDELSRHRCLNSSDTFTEDDFELLLDRFEKASHSLSKASMMETGVNPFVDDDAEDACCIVCTDDSSSDSDQLVFCDGCELVVHQHCYGVSL